MSILKYRVNTFLGKIHFTGPQNILQLLLNQFVEINPANQPLHFDYCHFSNT